MLLFQTFVNRGQNSKKQGRILQKKKVCAEKAVGKRRGVCYNTQSWRLDRRF